MGLSFFTSVGSPVLKIGTTAADFHAFGKVDCLNDILTKRVIGVLKEWLLLLIKVESHSNTYFALEDFKVLRIFKTFS